jgi:hypothetical protein
VAYSADLQKINLSGIKALNGFEKYFFMKSPYQNNKAYEPFSGFHAPCLFPGMLVSGTGLRPLQHTA